MGSGRLRKPIGGYLPLRDLITQGVSFLKHLLYLRRLRRYRKWTARPLFKFKVLVVMSEGVGNAVEATPLVQAIRALWPRAHITIYPPAGDLFDGWCVVDDIVTSPEGIKGEKYSHTFMCSGRIPESTDTTDLGRIHSVRCLLWKWFLKPEREYNLDMLRRLGYKGLVPPLYVSIREPEMAIPPGTLRASLVPGGKPVHAWRHKRWPHYSQLVESLLSKYPQMQICIVGGKNDEFPGVLPKHSRLIDLRGRLSLRETAWVLKHSKIAIGNDCGPMHIADAVQTPSIVIFGPTCELKNGYTYRAVPLWRDVPCRPCQYSDLIETCQTAHCMADLTPDIVLDRVNALLKSL